VTGEQLREKGPEYEEAAVLISTTYETIAFLVFSEMASFSVVRDFVGHGIGQGMHEEPKVPNYWDRHQANADFELQSGMVVAIEPMVNVGSHLVDYGSEDRWVVVTRDRKYAAHFEHTVLITEDGPEVLTRVPGSH